MKQPKIISKIPKGQKVVLMESDSNRSAFRYMMLYLENRKKLISGYSLKFYENISDNQSFMRLNRSIMIHRTFVEFIHFNDFSINNGRKINISRRRMKAFQDWI